MIRWNFRFILCPVSRDNRSIRFATTDGGSRFHSNSWVVFSIACVWNFGAIRFNQSSIWMPLKNINKLHHKLQSSFTDLCFRWTASRMHRLFQRFLPWRILEGAYETPHGWGPVQMPGLRPRLCSARQHEEPLENT